MSSPTTVATDWRALHGKHFDGARVLVTGGAGFIGSNLVEALTALGANIVVLDDLSGGARENIVPFGRVELVEGSILDADKLARCVRGSAYVFHQAALGSVPMSVERPRAYQDANARGTMEVLEACRAAGVKRVIFAASSSAYGDNPVPWIETMPPRPMSPYAATKLAGEGLLRAYSASYGLDSVSLRYFNIFGPRQNANSAYAAVIAAFAQAMLSGKPPVIFGDGEQSRDFTFVHNAVHANLLAARREAPLRGEVINVGCGASITVNELARMMGRMLSRSDLKPVHQPERAGDLRHSFADLAPALSMLEYAPVVPFEQGLAATVTHFSLSLARDPVQREVEGLG